MGVQGANKERKREGQVEGVGRECFIRVWNRSYNGASKYEALTKPEEDDSLG
jgi:hypothetical protein